MYEATWQLSQMTRGKQKGRHMEDKNKATWKADKARNEHNTETWIACPTQVGIRHEKKQTAEENIARLRV